MRVALLIFVLSCAASAESVTIVPREDAQALLHNPDMGWVLYENYPLDPRPNGSSTMLTLPEETFNGVDHVAVMFSWADVEERAGKYDFAKVDRAYDYWRRRGKQIQLRMSSESLLWWNTADPPGGRGVPRDVLDRLPADKKQTRKLDGIEYVVVDAREPVYLERLEKFLAAVASHFGRDRPVTLIDLRGFGVWGEWHSGYRYATPLARRAALCGILDHWSAAFPRHFLALCYSYDPDGPLEYYAGPTDRYDPASTGAYSDFLRYSAFDYALTKPNITFRRDGVGGTVHSNERRLNREAFETLATGPMSCEFVQTYAQAKGGGEKWLRFLLDDALSLHPNYINLIGYAGGDGAAFVREQPQLVARGLREMGYRLVPTRVSYPAAINTGEKFAVKMSWINRGVGRAIGDLHLFVSLADADGRVRATCDAGSIGADRWIKSKTYEVSRDAVFKDLAPGEYTLRLGLSQRDRAVALPLLDGDDGTYPIGAVMTKRQGDKVTR